MATHPQLRRFPSCGNKVRQSGDKKEFRNNGVKVRGREGLFLFLPKAVLFCLTRSPTKYKIESDISQWSGNVFYSCLCHERKRTHGQIKTLDKVRFETMRRSDRKSDHALLFLRILSDFTSPNCTSGNRQQTLKKTHADTLGILYTPNMQYTFLTLIASIILGVYGCGK